MWPRPRCADTAPILRSIDAKLSTIVRLLEEIRREVDYDAPLPRIIRNTTDRIPMLSAHYQEEDR